MPRMDNLLMEAMVLAETTPLSPPPAGPPLDHYYCFNKICGCSNTPNKRHCVGATKNAPTGDSCGPVNAHANEIRRRRGSRGCRGCRLS
jgi:hypothetical protein